MSTMFTFAMLMATSVVFALGWHDSTSIQDAVDIFRQTHSASGRIRALAETITAPTKLRDNDAEVPPMHFAGLATIPKRTSLESTHALSFNQPRSAVKQAALKGLKNGVTTAGTQHFSKQVSSTRRGIGRDTLYSESTAFDVQFESISIATDPWKSSRLLAEYSPIKILTNTAVTVGRRIMKARDELKAQRKQQRLEHRMYDELRSDDRLDNIARAEDTANEATTPGYHPGDKTLRKGQYYEQSKIIQQQQRDQQQKQLQLRQQQKNFNAGSVEHLSTPAAIEDTNVELERLFDDDFFNFFYFFYHFFNDDDGTDDDETTTDDTAGSDDAVGGTDDGPQRYTGWLYTLYRSGDDCGGETVAEYGEYGGVCQVDYDALYSYTIVFSSDECDDLAIRYYDNLNCEGAYIDYPYTSNFTECTPLVTDSISIQSYQGRCSIGTEIPLVMDSYVASFYNSMEGCDDTVPFEFSATATDTCIGYDFYPPMSLEVQCLADVQNVTLLVYNDSNTCAGVDYVYEAKAHGCYRNTTYPDFSDDSVAGDDDFDSTSTFTYYDTNCSAANTVLPSSSPTSFPTGTPTAIQFGYVYQQFYESNDCSGVPVFASGFYSGICQLYTDPDTNITYSFQIKFSTDACDDFSYVVFSDLSCKEYDFEVHTTNWTMCSTDTNTPVTEGIGLSFGSVVGRCSVNTEEVPAEMDGVLMSFYDDVTDGCDAMAMEFTEVGLNYCITYTEEQIMSAVYQCDESGNMTATYYENVTSCTNAGLADSYTIAPYCVSNTTVAQETDDDNTLPFTYVSGSCVVTNVGVPTVSPSEYPTSTPSITPTTQPTPVPTLQYGYLYYMFTSGSTCDGVGAYQDGIYSGTCMTNSDQDYSYNIKFASDDCANLTTFIYNDLHCTEFSHTQPFLGWTTCVDVTSVGPNDSSSAVLGSFQGRCHLGEDIPIEMNSTLVTFYQGKSQCSSLAVSFDAFADGLCFGNVTATGNSVLHSCSFGNEDGNTTRVSYYNSSTCGVGPTMPPNATVAVQMQNTPLGCYPNSTSPFGSDDDYFISADEDDQMDDNNALEKSVGYSFESSSSAMGYRRSDALSSDEMLTSLRLDFMSVATNSLVRTTATASTAPSNSAAVNNSSSTDDDEIGESALPYTYYEFSCALANIFRTPTLAPTKRPTYIPTGRPTTTPTVVPSATPSVVPTAVPTYLPTPLPGEPTCMPTLKPSAAPSVQPTATPTHPTVLPTEIPSILPTANPSRKPSSNPTKSPSLRPTMAPTTTTPTMSPTRNPTAIPTASPTNNDLVEFSAQQVINGISYDSYQTNASLYSYTIRETVASCMTNVTVNDIMDFEASPMQRRRLSTTKNAQYTATTSSSDSISTSYVVSVHNPDTSYSQLSDELTGAISDGVFNENLHEFSEESGASALSNSTSNDISTSNLGTTGDSSNGTSIGVIIGVVAGVVGFVGLYFIYTYCQGRSDGSGSPSNRSSTLSRNNSRSTTSSVNNATQGSTTEMTVRHSARSTTSGEDRTATVNPLVQNSTPVSSVPPHAVSVVAVPVTAADKSAVHPTSGKT